MTSELGFDPFDSDDFEVCSDDDGLRGQPPGPPPGIICGQGEHFLLGLANPQPYNARLCAQGLFIRATGPLKLEKVPSGWAGQNFAPLQPPPPQKTTLSRSNNLQHYNDNDDRLYTPQFKSAMPADAVVPAVQGTGAWSGENPGGNRNGMRRKIESGRGGHFLELSNVGGDITRTTAAAKAAAAAAAAAAGVVQESQESQEELNEEFFSKLQGNNDDTDSCDGIGFFNVPPPNNIPTGDLSATIKILLERGSYKNMTDTGWDGPLEMNEVIHFFADAGSSASAGTQNAYRIKRTGATSANALFYVCSCMPWFMGQKALGRGFRGRIKQCKHTAQLRGSGIEEERCRSDHPMRSATVNKTFQVALPHKGYRKAEIESMSNQDYFEDWIASEKFDGIRCYFGERASGELVTTMYGKI